MVWMPNARVYIEGVEYTGDTLADVSITYGKKDQTEKFRSSYARVNLLADGSGFPIQLQNRVTIYMPDSTNIDQLLFTGDISDITIDMLAPNLIRYTLNLVSPLAHLGRRLVGFDGYAEETEGTRILNILYEAGQRAWIEIPNTWADQVGTWLNFEAVSGTIDAGLTTLHTFNATAGYVTDFINICELSGQGFLYESTDGKMNYDDIKGRYDRQIALGWITVDPDDVILSGTSAQISTQFTTTAVQVSNYTGDTYLGTINSGVGEFGKLYENYETWIKGKPALETWMKWFLTRYGNDFPVLSSFTMPLSQLTNLQRDRMITMINGLPMQITGLPTAISSSAFQGYVEGWTWSIVQGEAFITLNISPKQYSYWAASAPAPGGFIFDELI